MINYVIGDATCPIGDGLKIISHVVNSSGAWGRGFVVALSQRWEHLGPRYRQSVRLNELKLGSVDLIRVESDIWVANMMAQKGLRSRDNPVPLRLDALTECLATLKTKAWRHSVHMPRIGTGLGGSAWNQVEPIIARELDGVDVFVYDLPVKK